MTFDPSVPTASQSPGVFPAQNNTNFSRLKTIINADHTFNDSAQTTDGYHKQMTLLARAHPVGPLTDANGMLYVFAGTTAQLWFYDGTNDIQLTPKETYPIRVVGSQSVGAGVTVTAYADPGFRWAGTGWAMIENQAIFRFYNLLRAGGNDVHEIDDNSGGTSRPTFSFSGDILKITNNDASTRTLTWSLIINRIS